MLASVWNIFSENGSKMRLQTAVGIHFVHGNLRWIPAQHFIVVATNSKKGPSVREWKAWNSEPSAKLRKFLDKRVTTPAYHISPFRLDPILKTNGLVENGGIQKPLRSPDTFVEFRRVWFQKPVQNSPVPGPNFLLLKRFQRVPLLPVIQFHRHLILKSFTCGKKI